MGNNACNCDFTPSSNISEKNLSRDIKTAQKILKKCNYTTFILNNSGFDSTKNFQSSSKNNIFCNNYNPSNISNLNKTPKNENIKIYEEKNSEKTNNEINNNQNNSFNETNISILNINNNINNYINNNDNSDSHKILKRNKTNINKIEINDNMLIYEDDKLINNSGKNKRKNEVYKTLLMSQSTKRLSESDLNSVIKRPTIDEYK